MPLRLNLELLPVNLLSLKKTVFYGILHSCFLQVKRRKDIIFEGQAPAQMKE
jgi:hypothetical protein